MSKIQTILLLVLIDFKKMGFSIFLLTCPPPLPGSQRWNKNGQISLGQGPFSWLPLLSKSVNLHRCPPGFWLAETLSRVQSQSKGTHEDVPLSSNQSPRNLLQIYIHTLWQSHSQSKVAITKNRSININSCQTAFLEIYRGQALTQPGNFQWF